jgi:hypothetical protein
VGNRQEQYTISIRDGHFPGNYNLKKKKLIRQLINKKKKIWRKFLQRSPRLISRRQLPGLLLIFGGVVSKNFGRQIRL